MDKYCSIDLGAYQTKIYFEDSSNQKKAEFLTWIIKDEDEHTLIGDVAADNAKQRKAYTQVRYNFLNSLTTNSCQEQDLVKSIFNELYRLHPEIDQTKHIAIVVPSYFDDINKNIVKGMIKKENLTMLSQGMAKAIFLAFNRRMTQGTKFAIYDWSAGQFEFSIFEVLEQQQIKQLSSVSSINISGYLMDEKLWHKIAEKYHEKRGRDLELQYFHYLNPELQVLKQDLNHRETVGIEIRIGGRHIIEISISELLLIIQSLVQESFQLSDKILKDYPVQQIYLTGGVTQLLALQQEIKTHFQPISASIIDDYQSDMATKGAIIYLQQIEAEKKRQDQLKSIPSHTVSIQKTIQQDSSKEAEDKIAQELKRRVEEQAKQKADEEQRIAVEQQKAEEEKPRALAAEQETLKNSSFNIKFVIGLIVFIFGLLILIDLSGKRPAEADATQAAREAYAAQAAADTAAASTVELEEETPTEEKTIADEQVNRPNLKTGMRWNTKVIDFRRPQDSYDNIELELKGVGYDSYRFDKTVKGRSNTTTELMYDHDLNLSSGATGTYSPALAYYQFPLYTGKTWRVMSNITGNKNKDKQLSEGEVLGWETISSRYWEDIKTLKIVVEFTAYKNGKELYKGLDVSWYYPAIGRAIKTEEYAWNEHTEEWEKGREQYVFNFDNP